MTDSLFAKIPLSPDVTEQPSTSTEDDRDDRDRQLVEQIGGEHLCHDVAATEDVDILVHLSSHGVSEFSHVTAEEGDTDRRISRRSVGDDVCRCGRATPNMAADSL